MGIVSGGVCDVGDIDVESVRDAVVVEDLEMLEGVACGPALDALSAGDDQGRVAKLVGEICGFEN